ncbi:hypothetical protein N7462_002552 [Penicillium macrosclerotiorum]|uniref:uncharacterized protein n=1 Tax=Penicillium macrosclerotiorum TaxID=303699 RepID=UPI002548F827|nr:uncharacterized protein N7462_002552 [Penicillium macrosclerotiorum]KAJ5693129.1 hypothetical protein N7462_002552 [Penicillium macrosclerotiorum]
MGWLGTGSLAATAGYFLSRKSPQSQTPDITSSTQPDSSSDAPGSPTDEPAATRHDAGISTPPHTHDDDDGLQTTPKASASDAPPPALAVPVLNLGGGSSGETTDATTEPYTKQTTTHAPTETRPLGRPNGTSNITAPAPPRSRPLPYAPSANPPPPPDPPAKPPPPPTSSVAPPRPNPITALRPPPSAAATLRAPPTSTGLSSSTLAPTPVKKPGSRKVILAPGFSPLDWAARAADPRNTLRGDLPPGLLRVTPAMLKTQNGRRGRDAWTSYQGRVYNIQPYAPYHPGGKGELLRGAGKDSGVLFQEVHPWVNWEGILGECLVGILVSDNDIVGDSLDAMD